MRTARLRLAALALVLYAMPATAQRSPLHLVVSNKLEGRFATFDCGEGTATSQLESLARQISAEPGAIAFDTGDFLGASGVTQRAVALDPNALGATIKAAGFEAIAVGHRDLAAPRAPFLAGARALGKQGLPYVLSNLRCDPSLTELCAAVVDADDPPVIVESASGKVAYIVLMPPSILATVAPDRSVGLRLEPVVVALPRAAAAARALGAQWVVASYDSGRQSEEEALALVEAVPANVGADILLVNELRSNIKSLNTAGGTIVVATRTDRAVVVDTALPQITRDAGPGSTPPEVHAYSDALNRRLCTERRPLLGGQLQRPLSRDDFANLLLDVMRERVHAEIGIINRPALKSAPFPIRDALDELNIERALPFEDTLWRGHISAAGLKAIALSPQASRLYLRGVVVKGAKIFVNGRKLDDDLTYSVVTTGFIATDGEGGLHTPLTLVGGPLGPSSLLIDWLRHPHQGDVTRAPVDPANHTRWWLRFALDTSYAATQISNNDTYKDSQLSRDQTRAFHLDAEFNANADHPRYSWENSLRLRYDLRSTISAAKGDTGYLETTDLLTSRDTLVIRGLLGKHWYSPLPFVESFLETELRAPPSRDYHHLYWRPIGGVRLQLAERFSIYGAVGVTWETLKPDEHPKFSVVAGWQLLDGILFKIGDRSVQAQSTLDIGIADPNNTNDFTIRFTAKLSVPLFSWLSFVAGYDLYTRRLGSGAFGLATDALVGLRVAVIRGLQGYRW